MFFRPSHEERVKRLGVSLKDVEHFRYYNREGQIMHVAVVVIRPGRAYIGTAACSKRDNYNRKRGYEIAVGRALKAADSPMIGFAVGTVDGVVLRDACRFVVEEALGPSWYPIMPKRGVLTYAN